MKVLAVLACFSLALGLGPADDQRVKRIIGGEMITPGSRPYMVSVQWNQRGTTSYCGGVLIHKDWVVTSAHCSYPTQFVGLGFSDLRDKKGIQVMESEKWIPHSDFDESYYANDIALVKLPRPAIITSRVKIIKIATGDPPAPGTTLSVSGWGAMGPPDDTYPYKLRHVEVDAIDIPRCEEMFKGVGFKALKNVFCALVEEGGKDTCQGDAGGPIVSHYSDKYTEDVVLEGIAAWGENCGSPAYPGVYTRVGNYCGWIKNVTMGAVDC